MSNEKKDLKEKSGFLVIVSFLMILLVIGTVHTMLAG